MQILYYKLCSQSPLTRETDKENWKQRLITIIRLHRYTGATNKWVMVWLIRGLIEFVFTKRMHNNYTKLRTHDRKNNPFIFSLVRFLSVFRPFLPTEYKLHQKTHAFSHCVYISNIATQANMKNETKHERTLNKLSKATKICLRFTIFTCPVRAGRQQHGNAILISHRCNDVNFQPDDCYCFIYNRHVWYGFATRQTTSYENRIGAHKVTITAKVYNLLCKN